MAPATPAAAPPNVRLFKAPLPKVWDALINAVQLELLLPIEVQDPKQGYFVTKKIVDPLNPQSAHYRLSGMVHAIPDGTTVTLYREQQVLDGYLWRSVPSDYSMERRILNHLEGRLR
jgi:hypothetical protein